VNRLPQARHLQRRIQEHSSFTHPSTTIRNVRRRRSCKPKRPWLPQPGHACP
jgi:hypothetical protein